jgi:uncharacterized protein YyaL (SSP411 family)
VFLTSDAYFTFSTPRSILTKSGEVVVHLAERPNDPTFIYSLQSVEAQVSNVRSCTSEKWAKRAKWAKGYKLLSQWGCLMVEAIRFVFDLMGLCRLTHTPHSAQAGSRSPQDVQDKRWIQSLGTQPCTGWLGTSGVSSNLFKPGPSADQPP